MDALVSGVAARIVFISGSEVTYVDAELPEKRHSSSRAALPYLLADAYDVEKVSGTTEAHAFDLLLRKWSTDRALRMLQIALDPEDEADIRDQALRHLKSLFKLMR